MGAQDYTAPSQDQRQLEQILAARNAALHGDMSYYNALKPSLSPTDLQTYFSQQALQTEIDRQNNYPTSSGNFIERGMGKLAGTANILAPAILGTMLGGAAGFGPMSGGEAGAAGAGASAGVGTASAPIDWSTATAGGVADTGFGAGTMPAGAGAEAGGGMANSIMSNPYAGGLGGTGGVDLGATGLGASSGVPTGLGGMGTGAGSLMGDAAAGGAAVGAAEGGSIWDTINGLLGPTGINGVSGAGILGTGLNYLTQRNAANQYGDLQNQVRQSGSALNDPQRQPYQANLSQLINNPSQYLNNDPYATSLAAYYKNNVIPRNVAASGNPASVLDEKGSQFVNAISGNYNTQVGQTSGIAGFGFPPSGYTPSAVGAAGAGAIGAGATATGGLANLFGRNQMPIQGQAGQGSSGTTIV